MAVEAPSSSSLGGDELGFRAPRWFRRLRGVYDPAVKKMFDEEDFICWHHDIVCDPVERNMHLLFHGQSHFSEDEEKKRMNKQMERDSKKAKMSNRMPDVVSNTKNKKNNKNKKRKRNKKKKKKENKEELMEEKTVDDLGQVMEEEEGEVFEDWSQVVGEWEKSNQFTHREEEWTINKGERYDISLLLSSPTTTRDYLIKNNGDRVKIDQLSGKYVLLYFWCLPRDQGRMPHETDTVLQSDLEETYCTYHPKGKFEVVFIALGNNQGVFCDSFSRMPWLAIPHEDQEARNSFVKKFAIPYSPFVQAVLFDPDGTVVEEDAGPFVDCFGAEGFPFTTQRMEDICREADALSDEILLKKHKPSLTALFGDYLISSEGNKVLTSELEGKVVGLYFFESSDDGIQRTKKLLNYWKSLKNRRHKPFEIVLVNDDHFNLSFSKDEFRKKLRCTIPWYSLPSGVQSTLPFDGRKLCRIFKRKGEDMVCTTGNFIILQPDRYQSLSYFAFDILEEFGIEAYPFTLERAVILRKSQQQNDLVLRKLLSPSAPLCRGGSTRYREDTTVSNLLGKRVLLLFATISCLQSGSVLHTLKLRYNEKKGTTDDFEIIYISLDCDESPYAFTSSIRLMPWFVHSFFPIFSVPLARKVFQVPPQLPAIAAFGQDGHLETKESNLAFKTEWDSKYPFIQAEMDKEIYREVINEYGWDLESFFPHNISSTE